MLGKKFKAVILLLINLLTHRPFQTLYINFKMLPFKQAVRLPIFVYTKTEFRSLKGQMSIIADKIIPNMIHIGDNTRYPSTNYPRSIWTINGNLVFRGAVKFFQGTYVYVAENAVLDVGTNGTFIGSDTKIICRDSIFIGDCVEITWECQIYDTSFHYVKSGDNEVSPLTSRIILYDHIWIGNRTTISKGTILPSYSIVASNSLLNKDYSKYGQECLFAGIPAQCKKSGVCRIFNSNEEDIYDKKYNYIRYKL